MVADEHIRFLPFRFGLVVEALPIPLTHLAQAAVVSGYVGQNPPVHGKGYLLYIAAFRRGVPVNQRRVIKHQRTADHILGFGPARIVVLALYQRHALTGENGTEEGNVLAV